MLWPGELPAEHLAALPAALIAIRAKGYWASPFPEGDGVTFKPTGAGSYDPTVGLDEFRATFPFLDLNALESGEGRSRALARLARDRTAVCIYLAPVEGLRLEAPFQLGRTRFHVPVDGVDNLLKDHAWRQLCDVPGADIDPAWAPGDSAHGTTEFLGHPLIEREIEIPLSVFYEAGNSFDSQSSLLRLLMEDADAALDPVRFGLCHYRRLEYLPAKPGWIGETANRVKVRRINGSAKDALDYADHPGGLSVIAVGGDKLSRGLRPLSASMYALSVGLSSNGSVIVERRRFRISAVAVLIASRERQTCGFIPHRR